MKPVRLEMCAFGPFADRQLIDFRVLGDRPFFLIHGPTGAGKTSILDAMCFALFGDSSGGERKAVQMRSHHAQSQTLTEVLFEFALGEQIYRVRRRPEQLRKAKRGGGETLEPQQAELHLLQTDGSTDGLKPMAAGWSRVTEAVSRLLGFESAQFRQVIILPQGKFFEFLKAGSQDREKILQTLFGTELYKRIEERLRITEADLQRQSGQWLAAKTALLEQARAASVEDVALRMTHETAVCEALQATEADLAQAAQAADTAVTVAQALHAQFVELDTAQAAVSALQSDAPALAGQRVQLARARAAVTVRPQVLLWQEATKALEEDTARCAHWHEQERAAQVAHAAALAAYDREVALASHREEVGARIVSLESLMTRAGLIEQARQDNALAQQDWKQAQSACTQTEQALVQARTRHHERLVALQAQRDQAAQLGSLEASVRSLEGALGAHEDLQRALVAQTAMRNDEALHAQRVQVAALGAQQAFERKAQVRQAWIAGQAARLADALHAGQPCPVCGASDHPTPAHAAGAVPVADDALLQADAAHDEAQEQLQWQQQHVLQTRQALAFGEQSVATLRAALSTHGVPPDQIRTQLETARARLVLASSAHSSLADTERALAEVTQAVQQAEMAEQLSQRRLSAAQAQASASAATLAAREEGMPIAWANLAQLQAEHLQAVALRERLHAALQAAAQALSAAASEHTRMQAQLQSAQAAQQRAQVALVGRERELSEQLAAQGFFDLIAWQAAVLDEVQLQALDETIRAHEADLSAGLLRMERALSQTRGCMRPDLERLKADQASAHSSHVQAVRAARAAQSVLEVSRASLQALQNHDAQFRQMELRYGLVKKVSDVASGHNVQRISFQRYVLATLLESVLSATTVRLRAMTQGRYEMRRKPAPADQRSAAGLDLEVMDQHTGMARAVQTLSGGESFMASLALALGLSDVVQAYSGGIRLDAIFVDEGFGTLDSEALDLAVRVLKDLQQSGRMVGIISHVAELKEWMEARLEIRASSTGSAARFVV
jgi:exonuclease SbcC